MGCYDDLRLCAATWLLIQAAPHLVASCLSFRLTLVNLLFLLREAAVVAVGADAFYLRRDELRAARRAARGPGPLPVLVYDVRQAEQHVQAVVPTISTASPV